MENKNHFSKKVEQLNGVSVIADTALNLGEITSDEHQEIKKKIAIWSVTISLKRWRHIAIINNINL